VDHAWVLGSRPLPPPTNQQQYHAWLSPLGRKR